MKWVIWNRHISRKPFLIKAKHIVFFIIIQSVILFLSFLLIDINSNYIYLHDISQGPFFDKVDEIESLHLYDASNVTLNDIHKCSNLHELSLVEDRKTKKKRNLEFLYGVNAEKIKLVGTWDNFEGLSYLSNANSIVINCCEYFTNEDLMSLVCLTKLDSLSIKTTGLSDISLVFEMNSLRFLDLSKNNGINTIVGIENIEYLEELNISSTGIYDLSPLFLCDNLKIVHVSDYQLTSEMYENLSKQFTIIVV